MAKAGKVFLEAVLVAIVGTAVALACNALSPWGLRLNRNYFPGGIAPRIATSGHTTGTNVVDKPTGLARSAGNDPGVRRLQERGLQVAASNDVVELFRDLRYEQGLVVFVDARDDQHYQAGHIPGAWQFNHYRAEQFLPTVLPVFLNAEKVVVYCGGGTCEDSEFAAIILRDVGVPREKLFVYAGGISEWMTNALPVETGARRSGQLKTKP